MREPVSVEDMAANTRRGGDIRVLLSPSTVNATSGLMGVADIQPGDAIREHYHPYSEEFVYLASGTVEVQLDGEPTGLRAGQALLVPRETRHRISNRGDVPARLVFALSPLAPRPELGHVDTE